jgi:hypothetical protein
MYLEQSLLGMAEEHFKAGYRSEMGAITQRLVEQQSDLHGQLQQAEKVGIQSRVTNIRTLVYLPLTHNDTNAP